MSDDAANGTAPLEDILAEGHRLVTRAAGRGIVLRVTGGAGIAMASESAREEPFARQYGDLDVAIRSSDRKAFTQLLAESGYIPDKNFNALHGARRLYFWDTTHGRQVDVFVDKVQMCHEIDLSGRLDLAGPALDGADLLLMKLQIFEANEKDLVDIAALTAGVPLTEGDEGININYLVELTANDWGLWRTTTMIAERARDYAEAMRMPATAHSVAGATRRIPPSRDRVDEDAPLESPGEDRRAQALVRVA